MASARWVVKRTGFNAKECRPENLFVYECLLDQKSRLRCFPHPGSFVCRNVRPGKSVRMFRFVSVVLFS